MPLPAIALIPLIPLATSILRGDDCWLGEPYAFSAAECRITLHNDDSKPLHVELRTHAATIEPTALDIPAKGSATARVHVDIGNASGRVERTVRVHSDRAADATIWVRGFAMNVLDNPLAEIQLGSVAIAKPGETTVAVDSHDVANFRVEKVLSKPEGIDVAIESSGRAIRVGVAADAPLGVIDGDVKLAINAPHQREAWLRVYADVHGEIAIESTPYWFGTVAPGSAEGALIPLKSTSGAPFRIGAVKLGMVEGTTSVVACEPAASGCLAIRVVFGAKQPRGATRATLDVELPDQHRRMHLRIWGLVQDPGTSDDGPLPAVTAPDNSAPWTEGIVDSVNAPVYAAPIEDPYEDTSAPAPPTEPPPGTGPLLKWQTASESGVYGYQVFRGETEDGPFLLQNEKIMRTHAKAYAGSPYFWRDNRATTGATYWYYVGVVYKDGSKQVLSSPHRKTAE
jgi:hypothetical protein